MTSTIEEPSVAIAGECATRERKEVKRCSHHRAAPACRLRPLIRGGKGRLSVPDWASGNLDSGFVKGSALIEEVRFAIDPLAEEGVSSEPVSDMGFLAPEN
jgi:hypothetical protein